MEGATNGRGALAIAILKWTGGIAATVVGGVAGGVLLLSITGAATRAVDQVDRDEQQSSRITALESRQELHDERYREVSKRLERIEQKLDRAPWLKP